MLELHPSAYGCESGLETVKALDVGAKRQVKALGVGHDDDEDHEEPNQAALDALANNAHYPRQRSAEKLDVDDNPEPRYHNAEAEEARVERVLRACVLKVVHLDGDAGRRGVVNWLAVAQLVGDFRLGD